MTVKSILANVICMSNKHEKKGRHEKLPFRNTNRKLKFTEGKTIDIYTD